MNNKKNRKGFTIVELAIVIAIIAILTVALIPTFGGIIEKAKKTKLERALYNEYTEYVINAGEDVLEDVVILLDGEYYEVTDGVPNPDPITEPTDCYYLLDEDDNKDNWVTKDGCTAGECLNTEGHKK